MDKAAVNVSTKVSPSVSKILGFKPYLLMLFLNAFVDLGHKIIIQNTVFKVYDGQKQIILIAAVNAMILLPYVLLFSPAAFISDRFAFIKVMRFSAWMATVITCLICLFYYIGAYKWTFGMTLVLAVQSTIYSPAKYGYIRQLVGKKLLTAGNALVQATTIIAILLGTIVFSVLFEYFLAEQTYQSESDILRLIAPAAWLLIICSVAELITAYRLPKDKARSERSRFELKQYFKGQVLKNNLAAVFSSKVIMLCILGLSLFWGISQMLLAAFPAYAKVHLNELNTVVIQGIIGSSGFGILGGSLLVSRLANSASRVGFIPFGALGMTLALLLLTYLDSKAALAFDFFAVGFFGACFIVPLNALIQERAPEAKLGTVLAGNNWLQNISMLGFLAITIGIALLGFSSRWLFYFMATVAAIGTIWLLKTYFRKLVQLVLTGLFRLRYDVSARNLPMLPKGGVLLLGSHISWLDWALIQMLLDRPIRFVIDRVFHEKWFLKWPLEHFQTIPISAKRSKKAIQDINAALVNDEVVCLFPEGQISYDGELSEIKRGFEYSLEGSGAALYVFYIDGMHGSVLSRCKAKDDGPKPKLRRAVTLHFSEMLADATEAKQVAKIMQQLEQEAVSTRALKHDIS